MSEFKRGPVQGSAKFGRRSRPAPPPPQRVGLVGATGLLGRTLIEVSSASDAARMVGIARREITMPEGALMELFVAEPEKWGEVMEAVQFRTLICALGTTWKKAGRSEEGFRAVDQELIVQTAKAAVKAGIPNMVLVSSAGADMRSKNLYLRVKGETEAMVSKVGFKRLDIIRPGLLKGRREGDFRLAERAALALSPLTDAMLPGKYAMFKSVDVRLVAEAALGLAMRKAAGRFTHNDEAMRRAAREWRARVSPEDED